MISMSFFSLVGLLLLIIVGGAIATFVAGALTAHREDLSLGVFRGGAWAFLWTIASGAASIFYAGMWFGAHGIAATQ